MIIFSNLLQLLLAGTLLVNAVHAQPTSPPDKNKIPLFMCGKYTVSRILVHPKMFYWRNSDINVAFQTQDTTELGEYFKKVHPPDSLSHIYIADTTIQIAGHLQSEIEHLLSFVNGKVMPHTVKFSQKNIGYMTIDVPIIVNQQNDIINAKFTFPQMQLIIEKAIQLKDDKGVLKEHSIFISAHMTHRIDFDDHSKFIPLIPLKEK